MTATLQPIAGSARGRCSSPRVKWALYQAAARATLAPSIHNTQPWRFVVHADRLDVYAESGRRAPAVDPAGRQLAISCGAALFGARVSLAAAHLDAVTTLLPDGDEPDLLATIRVVGMTSGLVEDARRLDAAADSRHSNRRQFTPDQVPADVVDRLTNAAEVEGAWLHSIRDLDDRVTLAILSQRADAMQNADPAYRSELRVWTTNDPSRHDGVPGTAIPHTIGAAHDDIPIRDFDTRGAGALPTQTRSSLGQTLLVLGTAGDGMRDWLSAGQALGRVLLELTSKGFVASILSQVVEVPSTRQQLRQELRLTGPPLALLRVGVAEPTGATPRRPLPEVITAVDYRG